MEILANNVRPNRGIVSLYENACNAEVNAIETGVFTLKNSSVCNYVKDFMGEESESSLTPSAKLYVTDTDDKQDDNQNNALELQGFSQDKCLDHII
ncbi:unnamed protein product [Rhizophagus irregularis]|nr:unnamed protein product [Rhizophagus irregularis]